MKKRLIIKFIIIYLPFIFGIGMFSLGYINLISSLLLFLGGYVSIKNTFDYRKIMKNIDSVRRNEDKCENNIMIEKSSNKDNSYVKKISSEDIIGIKRTRRYTRVRRIR